MSSKELIGSLNREAEERARAIREEAEAEAEKLRAEARRRAEALSLKYRAEEAEAVREKTSEIIAEAEAKAREIRQAATASLIERLRASAFSSLAGLRASGYDSVFKALAAEIPSYGWKTIRVNPGDKALASETLPNAEVVSDKRISGGMEAVSEDGRVKVINTFEQRLERVWDEVLPKLVGEAYEACGSGD